MNKESKLIALIIVITAGICFASLFAFTLPAFIKYLDFSNPSTSNIGATIGGITAPIIGILTSVLLYLTLTKQVESNKDQRLKNESDIIFLLLNQLDKEIDNFYFKYKENDKSIKFNGLEGFYEFSSYFRYELIQMTEKLFGFEQPNLL